MFYILSEARLLTSVFCSCQVLYILLRLVHCLLPKMEPQKVSNSALRSCFARYKREGTFVSPMLHGERKVLHTILLTAFSGPRKGSLKYASQDFIF